MAGTAGAPILALIPESRDTFTYGKTLVGSFNSDDETLTLVQTIARGAAPFATSTGVTVARSQTSGHVWTAFDDDASDGSFLREAHATSGVATRIVRTVNLSFYADSQIDLPVPFPPGVKTVRVAEQDGYHALHDLGCDRLLTVNRWTGQLVRLRLLKGASESAFWIAVVEKVYRLALVPADFAVNADGTRLVYCKNGGLHLWDLEKDVFLRTLYRAA
jgi:hypothetical protein